MMEQRFTCHLEGAHSATSLVQLHQTEPVCEDPQATDVRGVPVSGNQRSVISVFSLATMASRGSPATEDEVLELFAPPIPVPIPLVPWSPWDDFPNNTRGVVNFATTAYGRILKLSLWSRCRFEVTFMDYPSGDFLQNVRV